MTPLPFTAAPFFVLRTPSLPYEFQEAWARDLYGGCEPGPQGRAALRLRLKEAVRQPAIREALFLASPDLEATLDPWLAGELAPERSQRVAESLVRYLTRMSSRPTPFGLFAGCATGTWGASSRLEVPAWAACGRRTRLDLDYLEALVEALDRTPAVRASQTYRPNSSLYLAAGRWRYAEGRVGAGQGRAYHLVALEPTGHLRATLARAAAGPSLQQQAVALAEEEGVTLEEAGAFLEQLIDTQVLTSGLHPPLTGGEPLPALVDKLLADDRTRPLGATLAEVQEALDALDTAGPGNAPQRYHSIRASLAPFRVATDPKHLFQVDQFHPTAAPTLGPAVRRALEEAVERLRRLTPPRQPGPLDRFKQAFRERYDARWVPLLEALDEEAGIGFGEELGPHLDASPLLAGLAFPAAGAASRRPFTARDGLLLERLQALGQAREWHLDDRDLEALDNPDAPPCPDAFAAVAALAAESPEALAQGRFQVLMEQYAGPSGARLLGRFCQADVGLEARVRAHLAAEEALRPEAVFAEIVHQPDGRLGNILARPPLRAYEIPFLGVSGVAEACQIQPAELEVAVVGDRVVLRSTRLGREVLPRLTSAHNPSQGVPVYRFLTRLQDQGGGSGGWSWGCLEGLPFLPRVTRGRHVLARARWRIQGRELREALQASAQDCQAAFRLLRAQRGLPRLAVLADGDNALWVDLDHPLRAETLKRLVGQREHFDLLEAFPGPEALPATGPEGRYCHELVVPFERRASAAPAPAPVPGPALGPRTFPPGSEWLYLKIYSGQASADRILTETLAPLLAATRHLWDRWFFIRYADPMPHLRLRWHGDPAALTGTLLPLLHRALAPLLEDGLVWKLQVDTYERELERYGGPLGLDLAEPWFQADSEQVLAFLGQCAGDDGADRRWRRGLQGVDALLSGLGFDLAGKLGVVQFIRAGFAPEFQAKDGLDAQLGDRFRTLRPELGALLPGPPPTPRQQACLRGLREASDLGLLTQPLEGLAASLAHMQVNRLLRSSHRAQEFVLADFLCRLYRSLRRG